MIPDFTDPASRAMWNAYEARIERALRAVAPAIARDLHAELTAHLLDRFTSFDASLPEADRLRAAIARMGSPADYLRPIRADHPADGATRTARAVQVARWTMAICGYAMAAILFVLALLKPLWPSHVGMFRRPDEFVGFGALSDVRGMHDVLGWWFVPVSLGLALGLAMLARLCFGAGRLHRRSRWSILP